MGRRIPVSLTPEQSMVLLLVVAAVVVVLVALAVLERVLGRGIALALRLGGRPTPRKSPTRVALDELEERLRHRGS